MKQQSKNQWTVNMDSQLGGGIRYHKAYDSQHCRFSLIEVFHFVKRFNFLLIIFVSFCRRQWGKIANYQHQQARPNKGHYPQNRPRVRHIDQHQF